MANKSDNKATATNKSSTQQVEVPERLEDQYERFGLEYEDAEKRAKGLYQAIHDIGVSDWPDETKARLGLSGLMRIKQLETNIFCEALIQVVGAAMDHEDEEIRDLLQAELDMHAAAALPFMWWLEETKKDYGLMLEVFEQVKPIAGPARDNFDPVAAEEKFDISDAQVNALTKIREGELEIDSLTSIQRDAISATFPIDFVTYQAEKANFEIRAIEKILETLSKYDSTTPKTPIGRLVEDVLDEYQVTNADEAGDRYIALHTRTGAMIGPNPKRYWEPQLVLNSVFNAETIPMVLCLHMDQAIDEWAAHHEQHPNSDNSHILSPHEATMGSGIVATRRHFQASSVQDDIWEEEAFEPYTRLIEVEIGKSLAIQELGFALLQTYSDPEQACGILGTGFCHVIGSASKRVEPRVKELRRQGVQAVVNDSGELSFSHKGILFDNYSDLEVHLQQVPQAGQSGKSTMEGAKEQLLEQFSKAHMTKQEVFRALVTIRKAHFKSKDVAEVMGVSAQAMSELEKRDNPKEETIVSYGRAIGVDVTFSANMQPL